MIKDDGSFFVTCRLQDPGQFKSDCSGRQVLGTLPVTSVWYFLELQSHHSKVCVCTRITWGTSLVAQK